MSFYEKYGKRLLDIIISSTGLIFCSPIFVIVIILIKIGSLGPVFFCRERIGKGGKIFKLIKFRTMLIDEESYKHQFTPGSKQRVTIVGRILRKTKIDELPELINILRGEMSLVGPRPEVTKYIRYYNKNILSIKPGITDFASIKYRDEEELLALSESPEQTYIEEILPDKLKMNTAYLSKISLWQDLKILLLTFYQVIKK